MSTLPLEMPRVYQVVFEAHQRDEEGTLSEKTTEVFLGLLDRLSEGSVQKKDSKTLSQVEKNARELIVLLGTNPQEAQLLLKCEEFAELRTLLQQSALEHEQLSTIAALGQTATVLGLLKHLSEIAPKSETDLFNHQLKILERVLNDVNSTLPNMFTKRIEPIQDILRKFNNKIAMKGNEKLIASAIKKTNFYTKFNEMYVDLNNKVLKEAALCKKGPSDLLIKLEEAQLKYERALNAFFDFGEALNKSAGEELLPTGYVLTPPFALIGKPLTTAHWKSY